MKLQVALLAVGLFVSAGAVGAEFTRAAHVASVSTSSSTTISANQSSLKQSTPTTSSTITLGAKPSIKGGVGEDD